MTKRLTDIVIAAAALILSAPLLATAALLVWIEDRHWPLYRAVRVGRGNRDFRMAKLRSMVWDAERRGGTSTARSDRRITRVGHVLRRWKLDELPQFWNVLAGEMSIVGPRPNTRRGGVDTYTAEEMRLLHVRPGITDLASIVFSDEGLILDSAVDPDALYDAVIRPWKSRLGLLYIERADMRGDLWIMTLTALALVNKNLALRGVAQIVAAWDGGDDLVRVCRRDGPLARALPPGLRT